MVFLCTDIIHLQSQEDPLAFIRGETSALNSKEDIGLLEGLKEAWSDPKKSEDEKWLIDYFVNERFVGRVFVSTNAAAS